ncbi:MAG: hypothetical protein ACSHWU_04705 [Marinicella sp.]
MKVSNRDENNFMGLPMLVIVVLVVLYALSFSYSVLSLDTSRDIFRASQISQMTHWPLLGPDVGGFFHTGPIWFYFLAIPALTGSLVFMSFWVGVFAGLKFVFAYLLGQALLNKQFGLLWAFMLLLPGWQMLNQMIISHTNLLETLSLALLLVLFRFHLTQKIKYWYWAALIFALGFHAHPSFLVLVVFFLPVIWIHRSQLKISAWVLAFCIFIMPLLPYIWDQIAHGFPDYLRLMERDVLSDQIKASGKAVTDQIHWLPHWLSNLNALIISGPYRVIQFVASQSAIMGQVMLVLFLGVMLIIGLGAVLILQDNKYRRWLITGVSGLLLALLLITLLRSFTPYYMLFSVTALLQGVFALALYQVIKNRLVMTALLMMVLLTMNIIPIMMFKQASTNTHVSLGPVMNVNEALSSNWSVKGFSLDALTMQESAALSNLFCGKSTTVNGPMTSVLDFTGGATLLFYCEDYQVQLGGVNHASTQTVMLMHRAFWQAAQLTPTKWVTPAWGLVKKHKNHSSDVSITLLPFDDYVHPPRSQTQLGEFQEYQFEITVAASDFLMISNVLPANVQFQVNEITADSGAIELLQANATNRLYRCQNCIGQDVKWQINLTTNGQQAIDINSFAQ